MSTTYLQSLANLVSETRPPMLERAKKLKNSHDPLALVAHTGSSSRQTSSYYVTHPMSVVDYDDEYQQDDVHNNSEDPLVSAMNSSNTEEIAYKLSSKKVLWGGECMHHKVTGKLFKTISNSILQANSFTVNATTAVEKDIMLGIVQSQGMNFSFADASRWKKFKELNAT
ncbi:hypothetical protein Tco_1057633 [Tanacetum coccineum]|uniref:Uncharacterized protein n=1 Tax=Tanacetum coccineum TaxID=301880 RepID=A0ABQ5H6X3_9ASTR